MKILIVDTYCDDNPSISEIEGFHEVTILKYQNDAEKLILSSDYDFEVVMSSLTPLLHAPKAKERPEHYSYGCGLSIMCWAKRKKCQKYVVAKDAQWDYHVWIMKNAFGYDGSEDVDAEFLDEERKKINWKKVLDDLLV